MSQKDSNEGSDGLGGWLKEKCKAEKLSLRQAAAKTGLSHATIGDIINGKGVSAQTIKKLANAFGGDGHQGLVLEDELLALSGYRTSRPEEAALSEPLARLLDKLARFNEPKLKLMEHFVDYISSMEEKNV